MTDGDGPPDRLAEIAGLAAAIADRILQKHEAGASIPPSHFHMLVDAARILQNNGAPWPPSVEKVLMGVAKRAYEFDVVADGGNSGTEGENVVVQLIQRSDRKKRADADRADPKGAG